MAPKFDALKSVVPQRAAYRFLVRIDRLWVVPGFTKPDQAMAIEMVFLDQHGDKIQATVRKTLVYKFVDQLKEGVVYRFAYFSVVPNTGSYRATHHEHKLVFQMRTTVQPCESSVIPRHGLCCVSFAALLKYDKDSDFLIDVIGVLSGISTDREYLKDGKVTKMLVLELTNSRGKIECTLFGDFAYQIKCFIEPGNIHPTVIVLLYAKVKLYRGLCELCGCAKFNACFQASYKS
ncbi:hypothetical protein RIF29_28937 [Crotalaria pallida]|uniref:Replication protein A 70 kDa DNA-binding subunit B/D first OB fold domain-containing protein n=1 Tax=Crotalaria pallida TaxID=3830 RepID=A0AAN9EDP6_CROPI